MIELPRLLDSNKDTAVEIKPFKLYNYMYINHYK